MASAVRTDVAIVGGGPAGSICAALLAQMGWDVVLIHHSAPQSAWPEILSPEALLFLSRVGASSSIQEGILAPCQGIVDSWNRSESHFYDFQLLRCSSGAVITRGPFNAMLRQFAERQGVRIVVSEMPAVLHSKSDDQCIEVSLPATAQRVSASFLVDGTGVASQLMPRSYARRLRYDQLVAIGVNLTSKVAPPQSMLLASSSAGWWYAPDMTETAPTAVFVTDGDLIPKTIEALNIHLRVQFAEAFDENAFAALPRPPCRFQIRDARTTCRLQLWSGRWLPIGDAVFTLDPISGGGLARSFEMAEAAAESISDSLRTNRHEAIQRFATRNAALFTDNLAKLRQTYGPVSSNNSNHPFWQRRARSDAFMTPI